MDRREATRRAWLATLERHRRDWERPGSDGYWSPTLDCASRDEIVAVQDDTLRSLTPLSLRAQPVPSPALRPARARARLAAEDGVQGQTRARHQTEV